MVFKLSDKQLLKLDYPNSCYGLTFKDACTEVALVKEFVLYTTVHLGPGCQAFISQLAFLGGRYERFHWYFVCGSYHIIIKVTV